MKCFNKECKNYEEGRDNTNCIVLFDVELDQCPDLVKVEPIKEVCEFTLCHKTNYGIKYYESDCGLDYESPDGKSIYCRSCGKPIKIKE